jgi:hypothetical protein
MEAMQTAGIVPTMDYSRNGYGDSNFTFCFLGKWI